MFAQSWMGKNTSHKTNNWELENINDVLYTSWYMLHDWFQKVLRRSKFTICLWVYNWQIAIHLVQYNVYVDNRLNANIFLQKIFAETSKPVGKYSEMGKWQYSSFSVHLRQCFLTLENLRYLQFNSQNSPTISTSITMKRI